jgi:hypothetical protein
VAARLTCSDSLEIELIAWEYRREPQDIKLELTYLIISDYREKDTDNDL